MPAPGASLKGLQAYLSRWGLAQPRPRTLHFASRRAAQNKQEGGGPLTPRRCCCHDPVRPLQMCGSDEAPAHSPVLQDPPHWH